jgi:hypothetical protein
LAADSFSFAVAVDRERTSPTAVTEAGGAVSEEARDGNSSTDLCRVDSGVIGSFIMYSFYIL